MKNIFKSVIILAALTLVSCDKASFTTVLTVPLISDCESNIINYLNKLVENPDYDIDYSVQYFSDYILSHQSFVGFIDIYSNTESIENIRSLWNKPFLECYPTRSFEIDLSKKMTSSEILNEIYFHDKERDYYISMNGNVIRFWYAEGE